MKHLEFLQKYAAARPIFNFLLSVSQPDETLRLMLDILLQKLPPFHLSNIEGLCQSSGRKLT